MATLLKDIELKKLIGTVIINGDGSCIRPNSYVLRLGSGGEFLNTGKDFAIGSKKKKGIVIPPGHSAAITSFETLDFRRETIDTVFPNQDFHAILSPTTDLSREGIVAPTTQVDAGYHGTLNWTLTNTASTDRRFLYEERIYRLTIFRLEKDERPEQLYQGDYQSQIGYVRSRRRGAPVGMKASEWEHAHVKGGPEDILEELLKTGYPWNLLGQRLRIIDEQFKSVSEEYSDISDAINRVSKELIEMRHKYRDSSDTVRTVLREEINAIQNRWLIGAGSLMIGAFGIFLSICSNEAASKFFLNNGFAIGFALVTAAIVAFIVISRQK